MPTAENILIVVILVALPLRVVLDLASITKSKSSYDAAYAGLFIVAGTAMLINDSGSYWGYVALAISVWYLFSFLRKRKKGVINGVKQENT